jgi:hypothetical protein
MWVVTEWRSIWHVFCPSVLFYFSQAFVLEQSCAKLTLLFAHIGIIFCRVLIHWCSCLLLLVT